MYSDVSTWIAIILAGVAGCVATALVANKLKGVPVAAVAGNVWKHVWSIIFFVPVPLFLTWGSLGILVAFLWLVLVPTAASKVHFGPKDVPAIVLNYFHVGYAVVSLLVYSLVMAVAG